MKSFAKLILPLALGISLAAQVRTPRAGRGGQADRIGSVVDAVATFDGVFKTADKKFIEIQVESGDTMRMYITHTTKFIRDGKTVKAADFHDGDKVTADATRDVRLNLLAVKIENKPADKPAKEN
ncbi:MAG: hypothetical protein ABUS49_04675 [Acidobacteriota bacterium]